MIYAAPAAPQFIEAVQKLKDEQRRRARRTRQAKLRAKQALRQMR